MHSKSAALTMQRTAMPQLQPRATCRSRFSQPQPSRLVVKAATQAPEKTDEKSAKKKEEILQQFKKAGMSKAAAQKVLKTWEATGATDDRRLRSMVRRRSLGAVFGIVLQTVLDASVASGGFALGANLAAFDGLPLNWLWAFASVFVGSYYAIGTAFDFFTLGALITASLKFNTDSTAFYAAVREVAGGTDTGLNVIDKAAQARQTSKVFNALTNISDLLRESVGKDVEEGAGLSSLATYLLMTKAEEQGFDYEKEGMSYEEAGDIARLFNEYDTNDDNRLDLGEVTALARKLQPDLGQEDVKEAFKLLDTDNSRYIEFPEFVKLYKKQLQEPQAADAAT